MKHFILILSFFSLFTIGCTNKKNTEEPAAKAIDTIPMLVTQVQQCSRLYTTEYRIHKIITHDDKMKLSGSFMKQDFSVNLPLGDRRIAIPMDATLKAYIDLSSFSDKNIQRRGKELVVTLPDPKILLTSTKINHKEVKQYVALTRHNFTDAELTSYEAQGRKQIIASIPQMGIIEQAQESAARQLVPIFTAMGYKESDITISFRKKFTLKDLGQVIEVNKKRLKMEINTSDNVIIEQKNNENKPTKKGILSRILSFNKGCLLTFLIIISLCGGLFYWFNSANDISISADQRIDITPTQIQQIQDIGQWEFLAINDEELIDTVSRGFFSDSELVRIYYGTVRLGVDLHQTEPHWIRVENDSVIVAKLPPIGLLDTNFIDEAKSRSFFEKGDWTSADREQLYNRAYKKMIARCMTAENIMIAEKNAKQQFTQFLKAMGYKNVEVTITPRKASR